MSGPPPKRPGSFKKRPPGSSRPSPFPKRPRPAGSRPTNRPAFSPNRGRRPIPSSRGPAPRPQRNRDEISPARLEAARALFAMEKGAKVSQALEGDRRLQPLDESLFRELVYGSTRQKRLLDHHLSAFCQTPFQKLPTEVRIALRLGLYQLLFLERVPAHAAVHEAVNLVKLGGHEKLAGFANAVLRTLETKKASLKAEGNGEIDTLALRFSHPTWLVKKWTEKMEPPVLEKLLAADNQPHAVYLRVRPGFQEKVMEDLKHRGFECSPETWPPGVLRMRGQGSGLFSGESFQQGDWIVQDWAPQAMLELLPLQEGGKAWDVCAAPGGKTVGMAWKAGEKGQVLATDVSSERRKFLMDNLRRTGLSQVSVHGEGIPTLSPAQKFDVVWVDAPCSGTGVLSRRADLRWKLSPQNITDQIRAQGELLEQAGNHLYPGGYLAYSTCSLESDENEGVVEKYLAAHREFTIFEPQLPEGCPEIERRGPGVYFWPTDRHDGGFLALLKLSTHA